MLQRVEVDEKTLRRLVRVLRAESDGKTLGHDLVRELHAVAEPALQAARAALFAMPSKNQTIGPGLRATVANRTRITVRLSGKHPGVAIKSSKRGMPRGFNNAPKRLNAKSGWRHQVFGDTDTWVTQLGAPGWFDDTIPRFKPAAKRAAARAMADMAKRIEQRTKG